MRYTIYNPVRNSYFVLESFDDLIRWFARHNRNVWYSNKKGNDALDDITMNYNDIKIGYCPPGYQVSYEYRTTMVIDSYNRIIDPRQFKNQILNYEFKYNPIRKNKSKYEFRKDPVPNIRSKHPHRGSWVRCPRTTQERKLSCDTEIKEFVRPSRNLMNLPNAWDDQWRNKNHCWKSKKIKKQWMKNMR